MSWLSRHIAREATPEEAAFEWSEEGRLYPRWVGWLIAGSLGLAFWLAVAWAAFANNGLPPVRFDHPPRHGVVWLVSDTLVAQFCPGADAEACFIGFDTRGRCVVVRKPQVVNPLWLVRRHEYGHCNGWPADHRR